MRFGERYKGKRKVGAEMVDYDWGVEDVPMDFDSLGMIGTMGGSGGVIVMDDTVNMVEALANINAFYQHESCGQCTPCREGSLWMKKITSRMVHGDARAEDATLLKAVADQIPGRTICAFGEACSWPTQSFLAKFGDEFKGYAEAKKTKPAPAQPLI
jgi:NADH-quinone oxidoreductase subunit F